MRDRLGELSHSQVARHKAVCAAGGGDSEEKREVQASRLECARQTCLVFARLPIVVVLA
jgi:hypothetical protein